MCVSPARSKESVSIMSDGRLLFVFGQRQPFADQHLAEGEQHRAKEQADETEHQHAAKDSDDDQQ